MEIILNKKFIFWTQLKQKLKIKITKIIIEIINFLKKNIFLPLHLNWKIINKGNLVKKKKKSFFLKNKKLNREKKIISI